MDLHIQTAFTLSGVVILVLGGLELLAWLRIRRERALLLWSASNGLFSIGVVIQILRDSLPLPVTVLIGNGFMICGMGLLFSGVREFDGRPPRHGVTVLVTAAAVAALALSLAFGDDLGQRIVIVSAIFAIWTLASAASLSSGLGRTPLFSRSMTVTCLSLFALLHVVRIGAVLTGHMHPTVAIGGTPQVLLVVFTLALGMMWNFGGVLMVFDRMASTDDLTGLLNRRAALDRARILMEDCHARGRALSVLLVDLDHFKQVNDRFGHRVGDHVLERFAVIARRTLRASDVLGRHGGEEFLVVLPGLAEDGARAVAERLRAAAATHLAEVDGYPTGCTVAIGLATCAPTGRTTDDIERIIDAADTALYGAKSDGRNRVIVARPNPVPPPVAFSSDAAAAPCAPSVSMPAPLGPSGTPTG